MQFQHRIDVEIGERAAALFRVADVRAVQRKHGFGSPLTVDGELLREVGRAAGVCGGARGKQQQLAEVPLVQGDLTDRFAGQLLPAACRFLLLYANYKAAVRFDGQYGDGCGRGD